MKFRPVFVVKTEVNLDVRLFVRNVRGYRTGCGIDGSHCQSATHAAISKTVSRCEAYKHSTMILQLPIEFSSLSCFVWAVGVDWRLLDILSTKTSNRKFSHAARNYRQRWGNKRSFYSSRYVQLPEGMWQITVEARGSRLWFCIDWLWILEYNSGSNFECTGFQIRIIEFKSEWSNGRDRHDKGKRRPDH